MKDDLASTCPDWGTKFDEGEAPILLHRYGNGAEVAQLVAFLLGDDSKYITGDVISCDGGWGRV